MEEEVDPKKARYDTWIRTRRIGFASFIVPVTIILCLLAFWSNENVYKRIWPLAPGSIYMTLVYFGVWLNVEVFLNVFKYYLCRKVFNMSQEHYALIIGRRDRWTQAEITMLEDEYGAKTLKIMDATYRRAGHIIVNAWRIYYYLFLVDNTQRLQVAILQLPIIFGIKKYAEFHSVGDFVYQGCRIRDGQYGRFNQVVVNFWAYCARIIMMIMLSKQDYDEPTNRTLIALALQPLIWGDTFGEVIGSFFGRYEFNVIGIGEINKKTVEGTASVFISSYISLMAVYLLLAPKGIQMFSQHYAFVFFYTSFICMVVEVGAPRGTDNFFLQTVCLAILL